jgi:biotin synthase
MIDFPLRHNWQLSEILEIFSKPFNDLLLDAQLCHRQNFHANQVQLSSLLSIKTGACPEDCAYCPQSAHHATELAVEKLLSLDEVKAAAQAAKAQGSSRFCMGAAYRAPSDRQLEKIIEMVKEVKALGMETCLTLGMLTQAQAEKLKAVGLDYYNHNLDTSPSFYGQIITTRTYQDRLQTLAYVREAGIHVCSGGIVGMGETRDDRAALLQQLANLPVHPESVPINLLVQVEGTPLYGQENLDVLEFVRTIAVARLLMPKSFVRLSAGRQRLSEEAQALCFFAGANSIFFGEKLLTTDNPERQQDAALFARLGIQPAFT